MDTLLHRLARWAQANPEAAAQKTRSGDGWKAITAREYCDRVFYLALYLESRGFTQDDVAAIFSYNCPQWVHMDLAPSLIGGKSAGLYPNSTLKDILYVLNHTQAKVLSVQNKEYWKKLTNDKGQVELPESIQIVVVFDGDTSVSPKAVAYETALAEGRKLAAGKKLSDYLDRLDPKRGSFLIYTSGTTGNPKGVLLSHENVAFASDLVIRQWALPEYDGCTFSFLPLCHIAEKLQNIGVGISERYAVYYCSAFEELTKELPMAEPTILLCVPRLWEKMMEGVNAKLKSAPPAKKKLADWAFRVGARVADARYSGRMPNPLDLLQLQLADRLVLGKIRKALGLAKMPLSASGAAPLPPHVAKWFRALNIEILECYGLSESSGVVCLTTPGVECAGTVGRPAPGTEFRIADDGEILSKGKHIFLGYYKDEAATRASLDDGWLRSGDLGELDPTGKVRIRGRKREILKTSGGKMVAPLPIEEKLKEAPIISQVCMVGDNRKYFSALITLSETKLKEMDGGGLVKGVIVKDPGVVGEVQKHVDELNRSLASFEQIKKFTVLGREFSIADGEMTPTLKMKRNVIENRFKEVIDQMYH